MKFTLYDGIRRTVLFAVLLLFGCGHRIAGDSTDAKDILGSWVLETVGGVPPSAVAIKEWRISFSADKKWAYSGEMTGRFAGTQLSGSGQLKLRSDVLLYSAGANKGESKVTVKDKILTLSPDPIVMPDGKTPAVTTYKRSSQH
jgi:hypothetical protein